MIIIKLKAFIIQFVYFCISKKNSRIQIHNIFIYTFIS